MERVLRRGEVGGVTRKRAKAGGKIQGVKFAGRKIGTVLLGDLRKVPPATLEIPITTAAVAEDWEIQAQPYLKDLPVGIPGDFKPVLVRGQPGNPRGPFRVGVLAWLPAGGGSRYCTTTRCRNWPAGSRGTEAVR